MADSSRSNEREQQLRYVQVIGESVWQVESRVDGYRRALRDTVVEILKLERENVQRRTNITQRVTAQAQALGEFLVKSDWKEGEDSAS